MRKNIQRQEYSSSLLRSINYNQLMDEDETESKRKPNLSTWQTGKRIHYQRHRLIAEMMQQYMQQYSHLFINHDKQETRLFYSQITSGFESKAGSKDGWTVLTDEIIADLTLKGQDWDNEKKQEIDVKNLKRWLKFSKISEILYALSTAYLSIYSYKDSLHGIGLGFVAMLLVIQAIPVAIINYNGIDIEDAEDVLRPVIQIGEQKLIGTILSRADHKDTIHQKIIFDTEFDPRDPHFNTEKVKFYNQALKLWLQDKNNFTNCESANTVNAYINWLTFNGSNFVGGTGNWLIAGAFFDYMLSKTGDEWDGLKYIYVPLAGVMLILLTRAGIKYYEVFTRKSIEEAMRTFFTSDNALAQIWRISKFSAIESGIQWLTNGIARGFTLGLGFGAVLDQIISLARSITDVEFPENLKLVLMAIAGVLGIHNTLGSRLNGAKKYLDPFKVEGPFPRLNLVVADRKLLERERKHISLNAKEKTSLFVWAGVFGATVGVPVAGIMLLNGVSLPVSLGWGAGAFVIRSLINYLAEIEYALNIRAKNSIDERIQNMHNKQVKILRDQKQPDEFTTYNLFIPERKTEGTVLQRKLQSLIFPQAHQIKIQETLNRLSLKLGSSYGEGDCFFHAMAQAIEELNITIPGERTHPNYKKLRVICSKYLKKYGEDDKNWVKEAIFADSQTGGPALTVCLMTMEYTQPEIEKMYNQREMNYDMATWGRPHIEGKIICSTLDIKLHVIEAMEETLEKQNKSLIINHQVIDDKTSISNPNIDYKNTKMVHIFCYKAHYVPLFKSNRLETSDSKHLDSKPTVSESLHIEYLPVTEDQLDKNGNVKLTEEDIAGITWLFNLLDQAQRAQGRGGSLGQLMSGADTNELVIVMFLFWALFVTPQVCEFQTYIANTTGPLLKALNGIRESAGTPAEEIKGCYAALSHFVSRQTAWMFRCIIQPENKPIRGIAEQGCLEWFSSRWRYEKPHNREQDEKKPDEFKLLINTQSFTTEAKPPRNKCCCIII